MNEQDSSSDEGDLPLQKLSLGDLSEEVREQRGENSTDVQESSALNIYKFREGHVQLSVRELRARGLSFQIWPAAHALCWYLDEIFGHTGMVKSQIKQILVPRQQQQQPQQQQIEQKNKKGGRIRVLELGAGTGMVGILCAALGGECTITDLPHVTPNLVYNADLNREAIDSTGKGGSVETKTLRWGETKDMTDVGKSFDLIVASDVVYYDHLFEPLLATLKWLMLPDTSSNVVNSKANATVNVDVDAKLYSNDNSDNSNADVYKTCNESEKDVNGDRGPLVLLAHVRRWKKDSHFFRKASKLFNVTVVHKQTFDNDVRKAATVYCFSRREK